MDNQGIPAEVVSSNRILYTASALAKSSLLHLQEIGALKALQPHTSARSGLQSLLFFYVVEGSGELTYQGQRTALGPGSCVWVDCSRPYAHATGAGDLWNIRWIHFFGPMASAIYRKYREGGGKPVFYFPDLDTVSRTWMAMMERTIFAPVIIFAFGCSLLYNQGKGKPLLPEVEYVRNLRARTKHFPGNKRAIHGMRQQ